MKHLLLIIISIGLVSCSHTSQNRLPSAAGNSKIAGDYLGTASYGFMKKGKAIRAYFKPVLSEQGNETGEYNVMLFEYSGLGKAGTQFLISSKFESLAEKIGYLTVISDKIWLLRGEQVSSKKFNLYPLTLEGRSIVKSKTKQPWQLTLSNIPERNLHTFKHGAKYMLEGAKITTAGSGNIPKYIYFPKTKKNMALVKDSNHQRVSQPASLQHGIATLVYKYGKLLSTWRDGYLTGDYLSGYNRKFDKVLTLSKRGTTYNSGLNANFMRNNLAESLDGARRPKRFANVNQAFVEGNFSVTNPSSGMFLFRYVRGNGDAKKYLDNRIGLFIDIFDATAQGKDVVELALINPDNPEDIIMYFEHPDNGEGR